MTTSQTRALERVAKVLAAWRLSINGEGSGASVAPQVEAVWRQHLPDARAVLNTLLEPDAEMAAVGDADTWSRMVRAALGQAVERPAPAPRSWAEERETYQKPLG